MKRLKQSFHNIEPHQKPSEIYPNIDLSGIERWCYILEDYTQRALIKETDRLPAFAGIVTTMMKQHGVDEVYSRVDFMYAAGLWKAHLDIGLLW